TARRTERRRGTERSRHRPSAAHASQCPAASAGAPGPGATETAPQGWPGSTGGSQGVLDRLRVRFSRFLAALLDARDTVFHRPADRAVLLALVLRVEIDGRLAEDLASRRIVEERILEVLNAGVTHRRDRRWEVTDILEHAHLLGGRGQERDQLVGFLGVLALRRDREP